MSLERLKAQSDFGIAVLCGGAAGLGVFAVVTRPDAMTAFGIGILIAVTLIQIVSVGIRNATEARRAAPKETT